MSHSYISYDFKSLNIVSIILTSISVFTSISVDGACHLSLPTFETLSTTVVPSSGIKIGCKE